MFFELQSSFKWIHEPNFKVQDFSERFSAIMPSSRIDTDSPSGSSKTTSFFLIAPTFESLLSISTPFVDSSLSDDDETRSLNR